MENDLTELQELRRLWQESWKVRAIRAEQENEALHARVEMLQMRHEAAEIKLALLDKAINGDSKAVMSENFSVTDALSTEEWNRLMSIPDFAITKTVDSFADTEYVIDDLIIDRLI